MPVATSPLHASVGVEFSQEHNAVDAGIVEAMRAAAHSHACVLLRRVDLAPENLLDIAKHLGVPLPPYRPQFSVAGAPEVVRIGNLRGEDGSVVTYLNRGGVEWHSDSPGSSHPPGYSLLYCLESTLPDGGGETGFASTVTGYRTLPQKLKDRIAEVEVVQSFNTFNDKVAAYEGSAVAAQKGGLRTRNKDTVDRLVQVHPATGARHVYVSHAMVRDVPGLGMEAGMALIRDVVERMTAPDLIYKHAWQTGDLMMFDNRICLHTPFPYNYDDYPRTRRLLHQVIVGGRIV